MAQIREIKKRIKAVKNIQRITKTMQMIATSKFAKAQQRATASKPYTEGVYQLVQELAARAGNIDHPLISGPEGGVHPGTKERLLVITSDRGLCGPYNGSVIRTLFAYLRDGFPDVATGAAGRVVDIVGRKGLGVLKFNRIPMDRHLQFGDEPRYEEIERLAQGYMDQFVAGEISGVKVIYMRFESTSRQRPEVLQLLPLKPPASSEDGDASGSGVQYDFSPEPAELLADLLPEAVKSTLYQCFNDAIVSEHVARMVAMKSATDNASKLGKTLKRSFNRARQAQITTELTEIISGVAALE
ncbi:MAG: ATP synthase F1 subunit gamma [Planctomycetota bacterium]